MNVLLDKLRKYRSEKLKHPFIFSKERADDVEIQHSELLGVTPDQHHVGFVGLKDNAGGTVQPGTDDYIQLTDDGIINADASGTTIALSITGAILADGSVPLTSDWDIGDGRKIQADSIWARNGAGLALYDDGGMGIFVKDGGNVGIGTTSPDRKLSVSGDVLLNNNNVDRIEGRDSGGTITSMLWLDSSNRLVHRAPPGGSYTFQIATGDKVAIDSNGKVGIGTTTPGFLLDVDGTANAIKLFEGGTAHRHDDRYYTETEEDTWRNSVSQTEMGYLDGVTSDIQTQIDGKDNYDYWSFKIDGVAKDIVHSHNAFDFVAGDNVAITHTDTDQITIASPTLTDEYIQDLVGTMVMGNTETLIAVTYQDADGTLDFVVDEASISHDNIADVSADDHHNRSHAMSSGDDHTGDASYAQIDSLVSVSGTGVATKISRSDHIHTAGDGSDKVHHTSLDSVTADDHHDRSHDHSNASDGNALNPATFNLPTSAPGSPAHGDIYWDTPDLKIYNGPTTSWLSVTLT